MSRTGRSWRTLGFLVAIALLVAAGAYLLVADRPDQRIPAGVLRGHNLLLVTVDTLRADRLGGYGSRLGATPHLDRLSAEGIRFENVHAHAPLTLPSHASLFTGRYPTKHGVHDNGTFRLQPSEITLASMLQQGGYRTAAFVSAFVLDSRFGLDRGFELYDDDYGSKESKRPALTAFEIVERRAAQTTSPAEQWIRQVPAGVPWFAWIHLYDPHAPYDPPPSYLARYPEDPYTAEVAYVDQVLGGFLETLKSAGDLDRTLIAVTADHGESLGEHGEMRHGVFAYESTLRVPWVLWSSDLPRRVFSAPVRHVDLMPTVLDLLGVAEPPDIDGKSLRPYLSGELPYEAPPAYFEALNAHLTRDWAPLRGWIQNGYKLIDLPLPELYDLGRDPEERDNLHDLEAALASELRRELTAALGEDRLAEPAALDDETARRLRSLGYVSAPAEARRESHSEVDDPKRRIHLTNLYEEAAESFRLGDAERSIERLRELVTLDESSAEAHLALAYVLYESGRVGEAIRGLEQAIGKGIESAAMKRLLGVYLLQAGDLPRAVRYLEEAVHNDPLAVEARNHLAVAYSSIGRHDDARSELTAVLAAEPTSTEARVNLGTLELTVGRFDEAIAQFQQALDRNPDLPGALNGLGAAYLQTGNVEDSLASWRRAVEIDPQQYDALFNLAITLAERNPADAVPYLERFAETAPPTAYSAELAEARRLLKAISDGPARP